MRERRAVITGLGAITPIGNSAPAFWEGLIQGKNGVGPITKFNAEGYPVRFCAEVKNFDPTQWIEPKEARRMDVFTHYGIAAAEEAIQDSGLDFSKEDPTRVGVIVSSGIGGMIIYDVEHRKLLEKGPGRISPFFIPMMISDITAGHISIRHGLKGPNYATISACASSAHAIGVALMHIERGDADIMVVGGTEAVITPMAFAGFASMKALSERNEDPLHASRPFDKERDGFVIGEGAGILILEELSHARKRGAKIYAELGGFGFTADAYHITAPDEKGQGAMNAMRFALEDAEEDISSVDYINAHGTSTPYNDKIESMAIKSLFKEYAKSLWVSSNKSMIGHLLGGAGGVECVATALTIYHGIVPPTINYEVPDPECDLDYVPNTARERKVRVALSNSFGFGGHNVCLCLKRFSD